MKKWVAVLLLLTSCKKNPVDRLINPLAEGAVPQSSGIFVIYDDELKTGGGLGFIPSGENQSIDLNDHSEPRRSTAQIRYTWTGGDVAGQHLFAGFFLMITPDATTLDASTPKNLSTPGYARLTFYLRGQLSEGNVLRIEGPDDGTGGITPARTELAASSINNDWQLVSLTVPAGDFSAVKVFVTFSLQYTQPPRTTNNGEGGTIYLDNIEYER